MRFAIFPLHLFKLLCLPQKNDARSYEVLHLSRKIISSNLQIWCSKMQPLSGNQRPDLLTSLMMRLPRDMHLARSSANVPRLPSFLEMLRFSLEPICCPRARPGSAQPLPWTSEKRNTPTPKIKGKLRHKTLRRGAPSVSMALLEVEEKRCSLPFWRTLQDQSKQSNSTWAKKQLESPRDSRRRRAKKWLWPGTCASRHCTRWGVFCHLVREARSLLQPELTMHEIEPKISAIEALFSRMRFTYPKSFAHLASHKAGNAEALC